MSGFLEDIGSTKATKQNAENKEQVPITMMFKELIILEYRINGGGMRITEAWENQRFETYR